MQRETGIKRVQHVPRVGAERNMIGISGIEAEVEKSTRRVKINEKMILRTGVEVVRKLSTIPNIGVRKGMIVEPTRGETSVIGVAERETENA